MAIDLQTVSLPANGSGLIENDIRNRALCKVWFRLQVI